LNPLDGGACGTTPEIFEALNGQRVFIEAFAFEKPDDVLPGVPFLLWREINHDSVGLHHAVNRRLHCNSPQALPKTELRFGTKVPDRNYRVQQESSEWIG
jgi:hypothetical protein